MISKIDSKVMKRIVSAFLVVFCFNVCCKANPNIGNGDAISFIKSFYTEYITKTCGSLTNRDTIEKIQKKYCHSELLARIKKLQEEDSYLNSDPFLNAQDCDLEWLKTLTIEPDTKNNSWFIISYSYIDYSNSKKNVEIKLKVVSVDGFYYICDIEGL